MSERWPVGVDPADYRLVSSQTIVFPPGNPLDQIAALPDLPPGTLIDSSDDTGRLTDIRITE